MEHSLLSQLTVAYLQIHPEVDYLYIQTMERNQNYQLPVSKSKFSKSEKNQRLTKPNLIKMKNRPNPHLRLKNEKNDQNGEEKKPVKLNIF